MRSMATRFAWHLIRRSCARLSLRPAPLPLRAIFLWVPLAFAIGYWRRLLRSFRGERYFALHTRHAPREMAALVADVRSLIENDVTPHLRLVYSAIDKAAGARNDHAI